MAGTTGKARPRTRKTAPPPATAAASADTLRSSPVGRDEIARRAYELFLQDGERHGRDLEHWLAAEHEMYGGITAH